MWHCTISFLIDLVAELFDHEPISLWFDLATEPCDRDPSVSPCCRTIWPWHPFLTLLHNYVTLNLFPFDWPWCRVIWPWTPHPYYLTLVQSHVTLSVVRPACSRACCANMGPIPSGASRQSWPATTWPTARMAGTREPCVNVRRSFIVSLLIACVNWSQNLTFPK